MGKEKIQRDIIMQKHDVVIIGGGIIGSAIAYFLKYNLDFQGDVAVIERDTSYGKASTTRSLGGVRQQFSNRENIEIGLFGAEFVKNIKEHLAVDGESLDVGWVERGYLFLASNEGKKILIENQSLQNRLGAEIDILSPNDLKSKFPWLNTNGIAISSFGKSGEGWLDPSTFLNAFRSKARALGAQFINDEVRAITRVRQKIRSVTLGGGEKIECDFLVNASGAWAGNIARLANIDLPVVPKKRIIYGIDCREELEPKLPLVIDTSGVFIRSEGSGFVCGVSPPANLDPDAWDDMEVDYKLFDDIIWPSIANRIPALKAIKITNAWAGWYDYNTFDQNGIIGSHADVNNFFFANGFSGHGLQQSPAIGRAIMELITYGKYRSIDLSRFSHDRIIKKEALPEQNIV